MSRLIFAPPRGYYFCAMRTPHSGDWLRRLFGLGVLLAGLALHSPVRAQTAIGAEAFKQWAARAASGQAVLLDVRRPGELTKSGLVAGARHADFTSPDYANTLAALLPNSSTPLVIYCHSGGRARLAAEALQAKGYTVHWFDGMLSELQSAGVRFETWKGPAK